MKKPAFYGFLLIGILSFFQTSFAQDTLEVYREDELDTLQFVMEVEDTTLTGICVKPKENKEDRPLVVLIHGGGFTGGSPSNMDEAQSFFAKRGYVAFAPSYRLLSGDPCTAQGWWQAVQDVNAWIKFAVWQKSQGNIQFDENNVVLGGSSAGAVTALILTYTDDVDLQQMSAYYTAWGGLNASCYPGTAGYSYRIKGSVCAAGALPNFHLITGYDFAENTAMYFLHGMDDATVPETEGVGKACKGSTLPIHKLFGPAHLMADDQYHVGTTSPYPNVPLSPYIQPTNIYHHRFYVKNTPPHDHGTMIRPKDIQGSGLPPSELVKAFNGTTFNNQNNQTVYVQSISSWVYFVTQDPTASNNSKSDDPSGIETSFSRSRTLQVVPNPSTGTFSIVLPNRVGEKADIRLYNLLGEQVHDEAGRIQLDSYSLDLETQLSTGVYYINVIISGDTYFSKVVITR